MLELIVLGQEQYDEEKQEFTTVGDVTLRLEHSLSSLSKWESIHEKPFLDKSTKTTEEVKSYVRCMLRGNSDIEDAISRLGKSHYALIDEYLQKKHTATWFSDTKASASREIITAELIYYWMIVHQIPIEFQYWNLNKLFTLIRVCNTKQEKPKKQTPAQLAARNRALNAQRQAQYKTKG